MAANQDRGELSKHLGGQTRLLRFLSVEVALLEERLDSDPLQYIASGCGTTRFLINAVLVGLSRVDKKSKYTFGQVGGWIDDVEDKDAFAREILYTIARGKPAEEAKRMVDLLDQAFADEKAEREGKGPLPDGSPRPTNETT